MMKDGDVLMHCIEMIWHKIGDVCQNSEMRFAAELCSLNFRLIGYDSK